MHNDRLAYKAIGVLCMMLCALCMTLQAADKPYKRAGVLKTYRTCMKDKNFVQARKVLFDAVRQYPEAAADAQLYRYQMDALNELIGVENRKIYLNNKPDTVSYFNYLYELYETGLKCDSVEQHRVLSLRAAGKKAAPKLRSGVGQTMLPYRKNVLNAGKYYYKKQDYVNAFRFFDLYLQTKYSPVFEDTKGNSMLTDGDDVQEVSVLAVLSAYASSNHQGVKTYLRESLHDDELRSQLLEVGSKSMEAMGDTAGMLQLLKDGFDNYPEKDYFFIALVKYYNDHEDYEAALKHSLRRTELFPLKRDYWFMLGKEQMLLARGEEALASFGKCIEIKADDAEAYSSIGNIYLLQAHEAYALFNVPLSDPTYSKRKAAINTLYKQSCTAFEQARKFDEANTSLWLAGLRETYFKLNRGKALRALEKYK